MWPLQRRAIYVSPQIESLLFHALVTIGSQGIQISTRSSVMITIRGNYWRLLLATATDHAYTLITNPGRLLIMRPLQSQMIVFRRFFANMLYIYGERSLGYHCEVEWNASPYDIRSCESLNSFKAKLKTHLFSSAYHWSNCLLSSAVNNVLFIECFNGYAAIYLSHINLHRFDYLV